MKRFQKTPAALSCLASLLSACGQGTNSRSTDSGTWTYVDGSGKKTTLESVPSRIVAHANSAAALISMGIKPVGIYADRPVVQDLGLKNLDLSGIEIVGEEWGVADFIVWGMKVVVPEKPDEGFEYWETLSWETSNAGKYQADLLIVDERSYPANLGDAKKRPTWSSVRAAAADATAVWPAYWVRSYGDYAMALDRLSDAVDLADERLT